MNGLNKYVLNVTYDGLLKLCDDCATLYVANLQAGIDEKEE